MTENIATELTNISCDHCGKAYYRKHYSGPDYLSWCFDCAQDPISGKLLNDALIPSGFNVSSYRLTNDYVFCTNDRGDVYNKVKAIPKKFNIVTSNDLVSKTFNNLVDKAVESMNATPTIESSPSKEELKPELPNIISCDHCGKILNCLSEDLSNSYAVRIFYCKECFTTNYDNRTFNKLDISFYGITEKFWWNKRDYHMWVSSDNITKLASIPKKNTMTNNVPALINCDHCDSPIPDTNTINNIDDVHWCKSCFKTDLELLKSNGIATYFDINTPYHRWISDAAKVKALPKKIITITDAPKTINVSCDHCNKTLDATHFTPYKYWGDKEVLYWCKECVEAETELLNSQNIPIAFNDPHRATTTFRGYCESVPKLKLIPKKVITEVVETKEVAQKTILQTPTTETTCDHCGKHFQVKTGYTGKRWLVWCNDCAVNDTVGSQALKAVLLDTNFELSSLSRRNGDDSDQYYPILITDGGDLFNKVKAIPKKVLPELKPDINNEVLINIKELYKLFDKTKSNIEKITKIDILQEYPKVISWDDLQAGDKIEIIVNSNGILYNRTGTFLGNYPENNPIVYLDCGLDTGGSHVSVRRDQYTTEANYDYQKTAKALNIDLSKPNCWFANFNNTTTTTIKKIIESAPSKEITASIPCSDVKVGDRIQVEITKDNTTYVREGVFLGSYWRSDIKVMCLDEKLETPSHQSLVASFFLDDISYPYYKAAKELQLDLTAPNYWFECENKLVIKKIITPKAIAAISSDLPGMLSATIDTKDLHLPPDRSIIKEDRVGCYACGKDCKPPATNTEKLISACHECYNKAYKIYYKGAYLPIKEMVKGDGHIIYKEWTKELDQVKAELEAEQNNKPEHKRTGNTTIATVCYCCGLVCDDHNKPNERSICSECYKEAAIILNKSKPEDVKTLPDYYLHEPWFPTLDELKKTKESIANIKDVEKIELPKATFTNCYCCDTECKDWLISDGRNICSGCYEIAFFMIRKNSYPGITEDACIIDKAWFSILDHIKETINGSHKITTISNASIINQPPTFLSTLQSDATKAGYRVAAHQLNKAIKNAILLMMKDKGVEGGKIEAITEFFNTELGAALLSTLIGYALTYTPGLNEDKRAQQLAREFRLNGMSEAGNVLAGVMMDSFKEAITSLPELPESIITTIDDNKPSSSPVVEKQVTENKTNLDGELN